MEHLEMQTRSKGLEGHRRKMSKRGCLDNWRNWQCLKGIS